MVLLRAQDGRADYLALADAVLLLDTVDGLKVVSDERVNQLAGKEREAANRVPAGSALKLRRRGPHELLHQVRAAEAVDPEGRQWPRTKRSDDATAI
jgi:hypothetical protein